MFITELKAEDPADDYGKEIPEVYCICQDPLHYSITSSTAVQKIRRLEEIIGVDPGESKKRVKLNEYSYVKKILFKMLITELLQDNVLPKRKLKH